MNVGKGLTDITVDLGHPGWRDPSRWITKKHVGDEVLGPVGDSHPAGIVTNIRDDKPENWITVKHYDDTVSVGYEFNFYLLDVVGK